SSLLKKLQERGFVNRRGRSYNLVDPVRLLRTWREKYDFEKHHIVKGHLDARTGDRLAKQLSQLLSAQTIRHAATGLAGAWFFSHHALFRLATFYVDQMPEWDRMTQEGFQINEVGANCWIVVPDDDGVFDGTTERDDIPCVHPLQIYLDLKEQ